MRVNEILDNIGDIGWKGSEDDQGRDCLPYMENEDLSHGVFREMAEDIRSRAEVNGMSVSVEEDPFGNSYVTLFGDNIDKCVMICSHLDSVIRGGRFDGVLGVSAGLDVLNKFVDRGIIPKTSIKVAAFRSEESSVTGKSCLGSALATGSYEIDDLKKIEQRVLGKTIFDILLERGLSERNLQLLKENPYIDGDGLEAVLEVHVEQSDVLNSADKPFGIVIHGIGGSRRSNLVVKDLIESSSNNEGNLKLLRCVVNGEANHSGGTPMNGEIFDGSPVSMRKDALLAVAKFLKENSLGNVVEVSVPGGTYNVIPGQCVLDVLVSSEDDVEEIEKKFEASLKDGMFVDFEVMDRESADIQCIRDEVLATAMDIVCECEDLARETAVSTRGLVRATIGNVLCEEGNVTLFVDQRRLDNDIADRMAEEFLERINSVMKDTDFIEVVEDEGSLKLTLATPFGGEEIQNVMRELYKKLYGSLPLELGSMPGHDTSNIIRSRRNEHVPAGMIFVRGRNGGISHHPKEYSRREDIGKAVGFLFETVDELAFEVKKESFEDFVA
ncbi:M20/M25/M40 family metallo-hydrolase [Candidatus Peregrinibacteria bacterium]|nr:M20/M25/M40 family metallo-hydrolase [Candidatus Peregrinibacteria bacterium]